MNDKTTAPFRENLTLLFRRRSVIALLCVVLTLALAFYGIIAGVIKTAAELHENGFKSFVYFTMVSNTFAALSAAIVFPFTVEGIRKKRFLVPKWAALLHYAATSSIAVTMVFVLCFMSWASPEGAFGGANLVTHVICPPLILLSFFEMETGYLVGWKDRLLAVVPCFAYLVVYYIEVALIGEANGGWRDVYRVLEHTTPAAAIPAFLLLAFGVATAVALTSNHLTKKREQKTFALWKDDLDPIEVKIEAFGLGRAAAHGEETNVEIPYDILTALAERYGADAEELLRAFVKGLTVERADLEKRNGENKRPRK